MEVNTQITALYETGADVPTIARAMNVAPEFVHGVLFSTSARYRTALTAPAEGTKPLAEEMLDIIAGIARVGSVEGVRLAAARYVRDDQLGRRDAEITAVTAGANLLRDLGERYEKMQQARANFLANRPVVDVEEVE